MFSISPLESLLPHPPLLCAVGAEAPGPPTCMLDSAVEAQQEAGGWEESEGGGCSLPPPCPGARIEAPCPKPTGPGRWALCIVSLSLLPQPTG